MATALGRLIFGLVFWAAFGVAAYYFFGWLRPPQHRNRATCERQLAWHFYYAGHAPGTDFEWFELEEAAGWSWIGTNSPETSS